MIDILLLFKKEHPRHHLAGGNDEQQGQREDGRKQVKICSAPHAVRCRRRLGAKIPDGRPDPEVAG